MKLITTNFNKKKKKKKKKKNITSLEEFCLLVYNAVSFVESTACFLLHAGSLIGLFFDPKNGGEMLFRNVSWLSTDCTALYPKR
jgi:hypothetical protein